MATPIKLTTDNSQPLPNIRQYPLRPETFNGIRPNIQEFLKKGFIIPCTSSCNIPILLVRKTNGKDCRFVQDLGAINNIVILCHPVVPTNPHTLLSAIPADTCYFSVTDLCSAFFSIPVKKKASTSSPLHGLIVSTPGWLCHKAIQKALLIFLKYLKLIWLMYTFLTALL